MTAVTTTPENVAKAAAFREQAAACRKSAYDSFERSDTDGFLSQWASDVSAREYESKAKLAEQNGMMEELVLFYHGKLASTHQGWGQYGEWWRLNDEAAEAYGKRFFSPSKSQKNPAARDRAKGFTFGTVRVRAYVKLVGNQTSVSPAWFPVVEDMQNGNYTVTATDGARDFLDAKACEACGVGYGDTRMVDGKATCERCAREDGTAEEWAVAEKAMN